jgi:hypothetical protein
LFVIMNVIWSREMSGKMLLARWTDEEIRPTGVPLA